MNRSSKWFFNPEILAVLLLCSSIWACSWETKTPTTQLLTPPPDIQARLQIQRMQDPSTPINIGEQLFLRNQTQEYKHKRCGMCHLNTEQGTLQPFIEQKTTRINPFTDRPFGRIEAICTTCHSVLHLAHPVGIIPDPQKVALPPDAIGFRGEENSLTCMSCHDWHPTNTNYKYLRWSVKDEDKVGQFCLNCHTEQGISDNKELAQDFKTFKNYQFMDDPDFYLKESRAEKDQYFKGYRGSIFNLSNYTQRQKEKVQTTRDNQQTSSITRPIDDEKQGPAEDYKAQEDVIGPASDSVSEMSAEFKTNYELGRTYKQQGELNLAVIHLRKAIEIRPDFPLIYCELGEAHLDNGQLDEAQAMFQKAISLAADFAPAYLGVGNVYRARGNYPPAVKVYKTALKLDPDYGPAYYQLGLLHKQTGKTEAARLLFQKAVDAADTDYSAVYYELGLIYKQNNLLRAQEMFEQAVQEADHAGAYYELGLIYKQKEEYSNAVDMFNRAITAESDDPRVYCEIASIYKQQGHIDKAISAYTQATKIDKNFALAYYQLGIIFLENRQLPNANKMFSEAIRLNPNYYEASYKLAETCYRQKKTQAAIGFYKQVVEIKKDHAGAYFGLGMCYRKLGKPDKAIVNLKQVIVINPEHPQAHYILGTIFKAKGQIAEANKQLKLGIKLSRAGTDKPQRSASLWHDNIITHKILTGLDPENAEGFYDLGVAYMAAGKLKEATTAYRSAIDLRPRYWEALYEMALAHKAQDQWTKALDAFEQVIKLKPKFIDARHAMAEIFQAQNQWEQAIGQLQQILSHKPDTITYRIAQIYYNKWQINRQKDDLRKASEYFEQALRLNPQNIGAKNSLKKVQDLLSEADKPPLL